MALLLSCKKGDEEGTDSSAAAEESNTEESIANDSFDSDVDPNGYETPIDRF